MPDPVRILGALAAAAVLAGAAVLLCGWPWRKAHPTRTSLGGLLGVALGFVVGCWWLGFTPQWPPREDQDRWLLVLFPAVVAVEVAAVFLKRLPWLAWLLRLAVAAGAARILLHNTSYLADLAGPGTREWTP